MHLTITLVARPLSRRGRRCFSNIPSHRVPHSHRFYTEYEGDLDRVTEMEDRLLPLKNRMVNHKLWSAISTKEHVQAFTEVHAFAVWDFMTLLKALQRGLTCIDVDWVPPRLPQLARFINEIVVDEEADVIPQFAHPISHGELYVQAMREVGADTNAIILFMETLRNGGSVEDALMSPGVPEPSRAFIRATRRILATQSLPAIAAAFAFGREKVVPGMFHEAVQHLAATSNASEYSILIAYLERHIEVDGESHGPLARKMVAVLCGQEDGAWEEAERAASMAMQARIELWDGALEAVQRTIKGKVSPNRSSELLSRYLSQQSTAAPNVSADGALLN